ncbi:AMP-binding protein [Streptomyces prasinus]
MATAEHVSEPVEGLTIPRLLRRNARRFGDRPALTTGPGPEAGTLLWSQLRAEVAALARGFTVLGLQRGDRMLIAMSERAEHWIADLAAVHVGALPCSTDDTLSTAQIRAVARHSAATVLVLEGEEQLRRWRPVLDDLSHLRAVVLLDWSAAPAGDPRFVGYTAVRGALPPDDAGFEALTDAVAPDQPLALVYAPGATGGPEGVVLSHREVIHESLTQDRRLPVPDHPRSVACPPTGHVAERALGMYLPIRHAGHVTLCPEPDQLLPALRAVRPHAFFGTPGVWEGLAAALRAELAELPEERTAAPGQTRTTVPAAHRPHSGGGDVPTDPAETPERLDARVARPLREAVGLDDCHRALSGGAPLPAGVPEFLASVGLPVHEVRGVGEATGAAVTGAATTGTSGARTAETGETQPGPSPRRHVAADEPHTAAIEPTHP